MHDKDHVPEKTEPDEAHKQEPGHIAPKAIDTYLHFNVPPKIPKTKDEP
jgi:hypothetical protein